MKINKVLIIGGGSSGWMTAAALVRQLPNLDITLMEASDIPTVGVGESTIGHINSYMDAVGLKDEDWMKHCNATYKTSIRFTNFRDNPGEIGHHTFHYPFGVMDETDKPLGPNEWFYLNATNKEEFPIETMPYLYHPHIFACDAGKLPIKETPVRGFNFKYDTAYHMDAGLFGKYLKEEICKPEGVKHIVDEMVDATIGEDGSLSGVITKNNGTLTADLYIDCTGFRSLLLEGKMGAEFVSFHDTLLNDKAIATELPYLDRAEEMNSVTNCTAIESGWVWNIPLWNRIGTGYVYSSKHATQEEALEQFKNHLAGEYMDYKGSKEELKKRVEELKFRYIDIKHGVHKTAWVKNVVGIGLANGFIEPLESTGLMLTHEGIMKMIDVLHQRDGYVTKFDVDSFNFVFFDQIKGFKDFISMHYSLSKRNDTPYWKEVSEKTTYSESMNNWQATLRNSYMNFANNTYNEHSYDHNMGGIIYIAAGMGYNPINKRIINEAKEREHQFGASRFNYDLSKGAWEDYKYNNLIPNIEKMPTHFEYLKNIIYKEK